MVVLVCPLSDCPLSEVSLYVCLCVFMDAVEPRNVGLPEIQISGHYFCHSAILTIPD